MILVFFHNRYFTTRIHICIWYPRYHMHAYLPAPGSRVSHIRPRGFRDIIHLRYRASDTVPFADNIPAHYRQRQVIDWFRRKVVRLRDVWEELFLKIITVETGLKPVATWQ